MDHMHHMQPQSSFDWLALLSLFFFSGTLFYAFRFVAVGYMQRVNGYLDRENEFWHGVCLLGMSAMLTPQFVLPGLPIAATYWAGLFAVGTIWFLVRAFTYGRKLSHNKQWYDFAHAAMLFGMGWMFAAPFDHTAITIVFALYWTWFGSYYLYRLAGDFKKPHWLTIGQDIAHFVMALIMVLMTIWPTTFMPGHDHGTPSHNHGMPAHDHTMPPDGVICGPGQSAPDASKPVTDTATPAPDTSMPASDSSKPEHTSGEHHHH